MPAAPNDISLPLKVPDTFAASRAETEMVDPESTRTSWKRDLLPSDESDVDTALPPWTTLYRPMERGSAIGAGANDNFTRACAFVTFVDDAYAARAEELAKIDSIPAGSGAKRNLAMGVVRANDDLLVPPNVGRGARAGSLPTRLTGSAIVDSDAAVARRNSCTAALAVPVVDRAAGDVDTELVWETCEE